MLLQREPGAGRGGARAAMLVRAPAERVWNIVTSCDKARVYMAGLEHCEVLERRDGHTRARHVIDRGWLLPEMDYTFETRAEPYRRMEFELVEGNLNALHGWWRFEPTGQGLLVQHDITVDPSMPVPRWLVRRSIAEDLPEMMRCIRALSDGSESENTAETDRQACPGEVPEQGSAAID